MPQRSNDFQRLIFRLQAALHGSDCQIEESALVLNHISGKREEIDVLVTFKKGDLVYRTAVACQDRGRSAGPSWIRDLAGQRRQCRLDKVLAFHSKGFSSSAYKLAADENIGLYTTTQIDHVDLRAALELPSAVMTVVVRARLNEVFIPEPAGDKLPEDAHVGLAALVIDGQEVGGDSFGKTCKALIEEWCQNQIYAGGPTKEMPKTYSQLSSVEYRATLPPGSLGRLVSGTTFPIKALGGKAVVEHELKYMFEKGRRGIGKHAVVDAEGTIFGRGTRALVATDGESEHVHFEAKPDTDLKINSFTRERRASTNPFPSFEVEWAPESVMISAPGLE